MSRSFLKLPTRTLIYVAIVIVLAVVFIVQEFTTNERNTLVMPTLPDNVSRITVEKGGDQVVFSRQTNGADSAAASNSDTGPSPWVVGAANYPADQSRANGIMDAVTSIASVDVLTNSGDRKAYGLVADTHTVVTFYAGEKSVLTVEVGDRASAGSSVYARINDGREIVLLPGTTLAALTTKVDDFRAKDVVSIPSSDVVAVSAKGAGLPTVTASRAPAQDTSGDASESDASANPPAPDASGDTASTWTITAPVHVEQTAVDDVVRYLDSLRADGFLASTPDGAPFATLTVTRTSGTETISFYPKNADGNYPVMASSYDYPFYVSEWRAKRLLFGVDDYFAAFASASEPGTER